MIQQGLNQLVKEANKDAKLEVCDNIRDQIHNVTNYNSAYHTYFHYAIVLPSRQNSGWCEKVGYWN